MFVGEIMDVKAEQDVLGADGSLDVQKMNPIILGAGSMQYLKLGGVIGQAFEVGRGEGKSG